MREWLTDKEKRILFAALAREKKVCIEEDREFASETGRTNIKLLQSICESLEDKFYYDSLFKEIEKQARAKAIDDFAILMKEAINHDWATMKSYGPITYNRLFDKCNEIAEELKELEEK